jgi:hypothetical protein
MLLYYVLRLVCQQIVTDRVARKKRGDSTGYTCNSVRCDTRLQKQKGKQKVIPITPGFEPGIPRSVGGCLNHWAMRPLYWWRDDCCVNQFLQ